MEKLQQPADLDLSGSVAENWKKFKQRIEFYLVAVGKSDADDKTKNAIFLTVAGNEALDLYNVFTFTDEEKVTVDNVVTDVVKHTALLTKFEEYCAPKKNETYERYVFRSTIQKSLEPMDKFITNLKTRVKTCNFGQLEGSLVRDQIVLGVNDIKLKERLLRESDLDLPKAEKLCFAAEMVKTQMRELHTSNSCVVDTSNVDDIKLNKLKKKSWSSTPRSRRSTADSSSSYDCRNCGSRHGPRNCPAYQTKCSKCAKFNHFPSCCRIRSATRKIDVVAAANHGFHSADESEDFEQEFIIKCVLAGRVDDTFDWITQVSINNSLLSLKVDTGAQINVISLRDLEALAPRPKVEKGKIKLKSYQGGVIPCEGVCNLTIHAEGGDISVPFAVVPSQFQSVLGLTSALKMGIVDIPEGNQYTKHQLQIHAISQEPVQSAVFGRDVRKEVFEKYPGLFKGIGRFGEPYRITLKKDYTPVVYPVRRVPFFKKEPMREELDRMDKLGIISQVEHPTGFVNSVVLTTKTTGEIRFCLDPRGLNKAIEREQYPIITRDEIFAELSGAKYFSQLDLKSAYWQIPLHEDSKDLTTFGTPFGRYRFNVVPFGIHPASDLCQNRVEKYIVKEERRARAHQDNILIWGSDVLTHDQTLDKVLDNAVQCGVTLNPDKCEFRVTQTTFLGEILTPEGILPDTNKVKDVQLMQSPTSVEELRSVLGMINFFSKFIPNLSARTQCMRSLLSKDSVWSWDANHEQEFDNLKDIVTSSPVLSLFDPAKGHKVSADSSQGGIGAVLLQLEPDGWHPVAYASRALNKSEQEYVQIEKEALAMTWGMIRFNQYLHGHRFLVETDNKPLLTLCGRGLASAPARIQDFLLKTQKYDFEVEWVPRRYIQLADSLSKMYSHEVETEGTSVDSISHVRSVIRDIPIAENVWTSIRFQTSNDPVLQHLMVLLKEGKRLPGKYNDHVHELHVIDGVLFKNNQVVVPTSMRTEMLQKVHEGHLGIVKCKRRARQCLYWPGIGRDISDFIQKCDTCMENQYKQAPQPLTQEVQTNPWQKVAADIFTLGGKDYLLVVDYFSNYPEVLPIERKTAQAVIRALKSVFSRHGIPVEMTTDNMPFNSYEFHEFAQHYGFTIRTTSPNHPSSNGKAEKGVQIVKRMMKKCYDKGEDAFLALLNYRSTPLDCGKSPAQLLMNRQLKTRLPELFLDKQPQAHETMEKIMSGKSKQKAQFDKGSRTLQPLAQGQTVRIYDTQKGTYPRKGMVREQHSHQSYNVLTEEGRTLRRNRAHLRTTQEAFAPSPDYNEIELTELALPTGETHEHSTDSGRSATVGQDNEQDVGIQMSEAVVASPRHTPQLTITRPKRVVKRPKRLIEEV